MEEFKNNEPEKNGVVLYLQYENGIRSRSEFNTKLSEHYKREISLTKEEILDILKKRASLFGGAFNSEEITE